METKTQSRRQAKAPAYSYDVLPLKRGQGFYGRATPLKYGPEDRSPVFDTEGEAEAWVEKHKELQRFKEAARELGCDDDAARFEAKLGKIAKAKPMKETRHERHKG